MLTVIIVGFLFFALALYCVYRGNTVKPGEGRYNYVKETRRVWKSFERNPDNPLGLSNVYEDVEYYALKADPEGKYYSNGRKVK